MTRIIIIPAQALETLRRDVRVPKPDSRHIADRPPCRGVTARADNSEQVFRSANRARSFDFSRHHPALDTGADRYRMRKICLVHLSIVHIDRKRVKDDNKV